MSDRRGHEQLSPRTRGMARTVVCRLGARRLPLLLTLALALALFLVGPAAAAQKHPLKGTFPVVGGKGVGVDESNGNVFVRTNGAGSENAVRIFGAAGG